MATGTGLEPTPLDGENGACIFDDQGTGLEPMSPEGDAKTILRLQAGALEPTSINS
jgi:hypothetical protein